MTMNNKQNDKNTNSDLLSGLLTPIIEMMVEALNLLVQFSIKGLEVLIKELVKKYKGSSEKRKIINDDMTFSNKKSKSQLSFGFSVSDKTELLYSKIPLFNHSLIVGRTGQGKSNALMNLMNHFHGEELPIVYFDPKGNLSAINEFRFMAKFFNKTPYIFSETSLGNANFNPLKGLNNSQRAILIQNSFEWSEGEARYYKDRTITTILEEVLPKIEKSGKAVSFPEIYRCMGKYFQTKETSGFFAQLTLLMNSPFAHLFEDTDDEAISLLDIIQNRSCIYFGLSVQGYGSIARSFGKMFLNELQIISHELGLTKRYSTSQSDSPIPLIVDEAGAILYYDFINLYNKGRSSGFQIILSFQTVGDLEAVGPIFKNQIIANTGNLFIFNDPNNDDADLLAETIGTFKTQKTTNVVENDELTALGTVRDVREYYVNPQLIKDLKRGQCILSTKNPNQIHLVNVKDAYELDSVKSMKEELIKNGNIDEIMKSKDVNLEEKKELLIEKYSVESPVIKPLRIKK